MLAERREFPVLDVIEALAPLAQPELLETACINTPPVVAPIPTLF